MQPLIHQDSHLDHELKPEHFRFIRALDLPEGEIKVTTLTLPDDLPALPCALYGPAMGDDPVGDDEVFWSMRFLEDGVPRAGKSRMVRKSPRESRQLTVITGPHAGYPCVVFTAYAGPAAPQEPFEFSDGDPSKAESEAFWAQHALAPLR